MAAGHSVDDYLETIYFLAFPIGEYRPDTKGASTLALEVGAGQAEAVAAIVREAGFPETEAITDLAGIERVVVGRR